MSHGYVSTSKSAAAKRRALLAAILAARTER
jgi:hypothetical protein